MPRNLIIAIICFCLAGVLAGPSATEAQDLSTVNLDGNRMSSAVDLTALGPAHVEALAEAETLAQAVASFTGASAADKLDARLKAARRTTPRQRRWIMVLSLNRLSLDRYSETVHSFAWPAGEQVAMLNARVGDALAIAELPGVLSVSAMGGELSPAAGPAVGIGEPRSGPAPGAEALRAQAKRAPDWAKVESTAPSLPADDNGVEGRGGERFDGLNDLSESSDPHAAQEAWDLGYRGEGVKVAVVDSAVDFAHPDLQGTWAVLPEGHPHAGWPQVFDVRGLEEAVYDLRRGPLAKSTRMAYTGRIGLYQTDEPEMREVEGEMVLTACFKPLHGSYFTQLADDEICEYKVPDTSQGGTLRMGHHPDYQLGAQGARPDEDIDHEKAGVLGVDENESGVVDTIYVDMDGDRDFTDEKPITKEDPLGWRDLDGDGFADLSAGLLHFIADGEAPYPGSWAYGFENDIPEAGTLIGLLVARMDRGTNLASAIAGQGRLPLPDDIDMGIPGPAEGGPNMGLAPEARIVSVGDLYYRTLGFFYTPGSISSAVSVDVPRYQAAFRYLTYGHDPDREDDDIQVAAHGYQEIGAASIDFAGWSLTDRLMDHHVRTVAPELSMTFQNGGQGPGLSSLYPLAPATGIAVADATVSGSTGFDSATTVEQMVYGDIQANNSRGPDGRGGAGRSIAASGQGVAARMVNNAFSSGTHANTALAASYRAPATAAAGLALVYQAYQGLTGHWPVWVESRAILMGGARFNGHDVYSTGAGTMDVGDSVRAAAGLGGVFAHPPAWEAGSFRGKTPAAFPKILARGESQTRSFTLNNPSDEPITVQVSSGHLQRIGEDFSLITTTPDQESDSTVAPDYLVGLETDHVPEGTDLLSLRTVFDIDQLDVGLDNAVDNAFSMGVIQHTDTDEDGSLWTDTDGNGVVNHLALTGLQLHVRDGDSDQIHNAVSGASGFTPPVGTNGLPADGYKQLGDYGTACNEGGMPPAPPADLTDKFVLIERGGCAYAEKLTNALAAGASAALLYNSEGDPQPGAWGGGDGVSIRAAMIGREAGLALKARLEGGEDVEVAYRWAEIQRKGLDREAPLDEGASEIDQGEWMRMNVDGSLRWAAPARNMLHVNVHHPRERWADGLHLGFWHRTRGDGRVPVELRTHIESFAYQPWDLLSVPTEAIEIPAAKSVSFEASLNIPDVYPLGAIEGAIFVDYARAEGESRISGPGGWETEDRRLVIPVTANVGATFDGSEPIVLGGVESRDPEASFDNGSLHGMHPWGYSWTAGDHRRFFFDAPAQSAGNFWTIRTDWDPEDEQVDVNTQLAGPADDRYSNADHPDNAGQDDASDPDWYGPHGAEVITESLWDKQIFNTSTGEGQDWLVAPADRDGIHRLSTMAVRHSGAEPAVGFETTIGQLQISPAPPMLYGFDCQEVEVRSHLDLPEFASIVVGVQEPVVFEDYPIEQEIEPADAAFRQVIALPEGAVSLEITLEADPDDQLDVYILRDTNEDGDFDFASERYATQSGLTGISTFRLIDLEASDFEIRVFGALVRGDESAFTLRYLAGWGSSVKADLAPSEIRAGETEVFLLCPDEAALEGIDGPAYGVLRIDLGGLESAILLPLEWRREAPSWDIHLPLLGQGWDAERGG